MPFVTKCLRFCFALIFGLTPLLFLPFTSELFEFNKLFLIYLLTIIILGCWAIQMFSEKRVIFKRTPLDLPLLLFLGISIVSSLLSIDTHTSLIGYYGRWNGGLYSLLSYAVLYWAYVSNIDKEVSQKLIKYTLLPSVVIVAIYASLEHFGFSFSCLAITGKFGVDCWVQDVQNRVFATIGQPNWLAAYLVGLIFIPLAYVLESKKAPYLQIAISYLLYICLIFTKSRSGILAFGISSLIFWFLPFFTAKTKKYLPLSIFFGVAIFFGLLIKNPIQEYLFKSSTPNTSVGPALEVGGTESGAIRKIVWEGAINIWRESTKTLLIGTGPETFAMAYYNHRPLAHNNTSEWELLYNKAHNEFLNQLATTGLLGLASYIFLLIMMAKLFFGHKTSSPLQLALFCGWISISVTNFLGFSVVVTQILLFLLPAISLSLQTSKLSNKVYVQPLFSIGVFLIAGIAIYFVGKIWISDIHYASSQKYLSYFSRADNPDPQDLLTAYNEASIAYDLNPNEPFIDTQLADTAAYLALYTGEKDATTSSQLTTLATMASQKALATSPLHPLHYKSAARVYILLSAFKPEYLTTADKILQYAQDLSPTDPRIPYNRAIIAKYQQDKPKAKQLFLDSLKLKSDFGDAIAQVSQLASDSAKPKK